MTDRTLKIILASILVFIIILLTGILIFALSGKNLRFGAFKINSKAELLLDEKYNLGEIEKIDVSSKAADVKFTVDDTIQDIKVVIYGDKDQQASSSFENGTLKVNYSPSVLCFGFCFDNSHIDITLPSKYYQDIQVNTVSGDVHLATTLAEKLEVKTVSGEIKIGNYKDVKLTTTSGDILVDSADAVEAKTVSGEVEVNSVTKSIDIGTTSGDVDINNLMLLSNSNIKTVSGDVEIKRISDVYVNTKTVSGDVDIRTNNRMSDVELMITTTSGDIEVD